jgi:hypothetical protein
MTVRYVQRAQTSPTTERGTNFKPSEHTYDRAKQRVAPRHLDRYVRLRNVQP